MVVLGKLPVVGCPTNLDWSRARPQGPTAYAVGACGGCLHISFSRLSFLFLSHSIWETARYRLKYCLKVPLSPKQPTNHCSVGDPGSKMALRRGAHGFENEICLKIFSRTVRLRCLTLASSLFK